MKLYTTLDERNEIADFESLSKSLDNISAEVEKDLKDFFRDESNHVFDMSGAYEASCNLVNADLDHGSHKFTPELVSIVRELRMLRKESPSELRRLKEYFASDFALDKKTKKKKKNMFFRILSSIGYFLIGYKIIF